MEERLAPGQEVEGSNPSSRSNPLLVVGGGLAGSMVATLARRAGWQVEVFDCGENWAASPASSNLSMPSWVRGLGQWGTAGLEALRQDWPIREIEFSGEKGTISALHLDQDDILVDARRERVEWVRDGALLAESGVHEGTVVVAAGVWSGQLIQGLPDIQALAGHSMVFQGTWPDKPVLRLWAPYKHLKVFQWKPNCIWFGDSTAIKQVNYKPDEAELRSLARARALGLLGQDWWKTLRGLRPAVKGQPVLLKQISPKLWVLTGGGKMGMTVYAAAARQLVESL